VLNSSISLATAAALFTVLAVSPVAAQTSSPAPTLPLTGTFTPEQTQAIQRVIHDYLMQHPEVILDAVESMEQKRHDEAQAAAKSTIAQRQDELLHDPGSPVAGNPKGDVTIVEFFDYRCPYCKQMEPSLAQLLKEDGKLRYVYKEFPILGPDSVVATRAALAARKQNKYQELHDALMRARGTLDEATVLKIAADTGLDTRRLKADMGSSDVEAVIDRNKDLARALGVSGTPGFIVGTQLVPGAVDLPTLKKLVAEARKTD
jgi:protein-disulfide isomerase